MSSFGKHSPPPTPTPSDQASEPIVESPKRERALSFSSLKKSIIRANSSGSLRIKAAANNNALTMSESPPPERTKMSSSPPTNLSSSYSPTSSSSNPNTHSNSTPTTPTFVQSKPIQVTRGFSLNQSMDTSRLKSTNRTTKITTEQMVSHTPSREDLIIDSTVSQDLRKHRTSTLRILKSLLEILNVEEITRDSIVKALLPNVEHSIQNTLESSSGLNEMKSILSEATKFLDFERYLRSVVKIQSFWRKFYYRRRYPQAKKYTSNSQLRKRNEFILELFENEKKLVSRLIIIVNKYLLPLRDLIHSKKMIVSDDDLNILFNNSEKLLRLHSKIRENLSSLIDKWPFLDDIGDVFLSTLEEFSVYGTYVENLKTAFLHLQHLTATNSKFQDFLEKTAASSQSEDSLRTLLNAPLDQMSLYVRVLEQLIDVTPTDHPGQEKLSRASALMQQTSQYLQGLNSESEATALVLKVQHQLENTFSVVRNKRRLIGEWDSKKIALNKSQKYEKCKAFLFNDLLLLTTRSNHKWKVIEPIEIDTDLSTSSDTSKEHFRLVLAFAKSSATIDLNNAADLKSFQNALSELISANDAKMKTFGINFNFILKREQSSVPNFLDIMAKHLKSHHLDTEGLFRLSAGTKELADLKAQLDHGLFDPSKIASHSSHALANIIKLWFRELPEPMFGFKLYPKLNSIADIQDETKRYVALYELLKSDVPPTNRAIIEYLFRFLNEVSAHSSQNRMSASNLAIVFAPNLIRPEVETLETSLSSARLTVLIEDYIVMYKP